MAEDKKVFCKDCKYMDAEEKCSVNPRTDYVKGVVINWTCSTKNVLGDCKDFEAKK